MMAMSLSIPTLRFLLDENVRIELSRHLKEKGFDVKSMPKSTPPQTLISSFVKLLSEFTSFEGKLIILEPNKWQDFPLEEVS